MVFGDYVFCIGRLSCLAALFGMYFNAKYPAKIPWSYQEWVDIHLAQHWTYSILSVIGSQRPWNSPDERPVQVQTDRRSSLWRVTGT